MEFELAPFDLPSGYGDGIVPLADMKEHLRVDTDDEDALIGIYRDAAVDMVERYCGVRLAECSGLEWKAERLNSRLRLGVWPVNAVTGVAWLDSEGSEVAGDASIWRVVRRDEVAIKPGASLPGNVAAGVLVTFDAGFTDDNRPASLVQAVKLFCSHLYLNREATSSGAVSGEIPLGFRQLCSQYRMPVI